MATSRSVCVYTLWLNMHACSYRILVNVAIYSYLYTYLYTKVLKLYYVNRYELFSSMPLTYYILSLFMLTLAVHFIHL